MNELLAMARALEMDVDTMDTARDAQVIRDAIASHADLQHRYLTEKAAWRGEAGQIRNLRFYTCEDDHLDREEVLKILDASLLHRAVSPSAPPGEPRDMTVAIEKLSERMEALFQRTYVAGFAQGYIAGVRRAPSLIEKDWNISSEALTQEIETAALVTYGQGNHK